MVTDRKRKPVFAIGTVLLILLLAYLGLYQSGHIGITDDKINDEQMKTVAWDPQDYQTVGTAEENGSLYVGVMFLEDHSAAKYFLYGNKTGLSFGWRFLQSGDLINIDGLTEFDCGKYGTAYVALNKNGNIQKIEYEDGREPCENTSYVIIEQTKEPVHFYDGNGNRIEPFVLPVIS